MTVLLVLVGGAVGAPLRFWADRASRRRFGTSVWGTLGANVIGSFLLGLFAALLASGNVPSLTYALLGTGVCGALTTYSTLALEVVELGEGGRLAAASAYLSGSLVLGLAAASLGWVLV